MRIITQVAYPEYVRTARHGVPKSPAQGAELIADATRIKAVLGCT